MGHNLLIGGRFRDLAYLIQKLYEQVKSLLIVDEDGHLWEGEFGQKWLVQELFEHGTEGIRADIDFN